MHVCAYTHPHKHIHIPLPIIPPLFHLEYLGECYFLTEKEVPSNFRDQEDLVILTGRWPLGWIWWMVE